MRGRSTLNCLSRVRPWTRAGEETQRGGLCSFLEAKQEACPGHWDAGTSSLWVLAFGPGTCWGLAACGPGVGTTKSVCQQQGGWGVLEQHPSLQQSRGRAKWWWNQAHVPRCLVTGWLCEKCQGCPQPSLCLHIGILESGGWQPELGCLCRAACGKVPRDGTDYSQGHYPLGSG